MEEWPERCNVTGFEDGGRDQEPRKVDSILDTEKGKETDCLQNFWEGMQLY
jgi:hypothetical protein